MADPKPFSPIRYFFDEHVRRAIVLALRRYGIDVLTAAEAERANKGIEDDEQVMFASAEGHIFVSNDMDVLNGQVVPQVLIGQHAGIVYLEQRVSIGAGALPQVHRRDRDAGEHRRPDSLLRAHPARMFPDD